MEKFFGVREIAERAGLATSTVWAHRTDPSCPLHGDGMLKQRMTRRVVASGATVSDYIRWLKQPIPPARESVASKSSEVA